MPWSPARGCRSTIPRSRAALARGLPVVSELDLATDWETERVASGARPRPVLAITGTDGKTTVTTMVTEMMEASGRKALAVGNTDVPFVAALDEDVETFVVEASSFRLRFAERFSPRVATWLNVAPDHLDWHPSARGLRGGEGPHLRAPGRGRGRGGERGGRNRARPPPACSGAACHLRLGSRRVPRPRRRDHDPG